MGGPGDYVHRGGVEGEIEDFLPGWGGLVGGVRMEGVYWGDGGGEVPLVALFTPYEYFSVVAC